MAGKILICWRILIQKIDIIIYFLSLSDKLLLMTNNIVNILDQFEKSIDLKQPYLKTNLEENAEIEFKNSLQTKSDTIDKGYLKTISGFANNSGGTIIFGVSPDKHEIVGIKEEYENLDGRYVSSTIANGLDGSFKFQFVTKRFLSKVVGFLVVEKAMTKPVIMKVDAAEFKLGEIYYRYPAQTSKIQAQDLRRILNEEVATGINRVMGNMNKLISIGEDAAILDTSSGIIDTGDHQPKFVLDEKMLKNLNLIKRGQFVEEEGAPAYLIKGEIETGNVEVVEKTVLSNLYESDIMNYFTSGSCDCPELVLEKLLSLSSPYFPVHFFMSQCNWGVKEALEFIDSPVIKNVNSNTADKVRERITTEYSYGKNGVISLEILETLKDGTCPIIHLTTVAGKYGLGKTMHQKVVRTMIYNTMKIHSDLGQDVFDEYPSLVVDALSNLEQDYVKANPEYVLSIIQKLYPQKNNTVLKKAICFIDKVLYARQASAPVQKIAYAVEVEEG
ncbi:MAG: ATP-binding protein [Candidatus Pedobacter colombiensis]|uniref:ATP-binding protein n=1 Tax=Candidatus Pedobacter colombiensis TaxID=3121371 RepID=A0AAJ5WB36_9SPHI|nr:ATP-binding protein [Pedobacter sp.]WEK21065.1 MAG: ATP-binding protein [Pedobacter sp.]